MIVIQRIKPGVGNYLPALRKVVAAAFVVNNESTLVWVYAEKKARAVAAAPDGEPVLPGDLPDFPEIGRDDGWASAGVSREKWEADPSAVLHHLEDELAAQ